MTLDEILWHFTTPPHHEAWSLFVYEMRGKQYGRDALMQAWEFFRRGWEISLAQEIFLGELQGLRDKLRIAEAVRDDARASSQKYLDEKRQAEARANIFMEDAAKYQALKDDTL